MQKEIEYLRRITTRRYLLKKNSKLVILFVIKLLMIRFKIYLLQHLTITKKLNR